MQGVLEPKCKKQFIWKTRSNNGYIGINREEQWMSLILRTKLQVQNRPVTVSRWGNTGEVGRTRHFKTIQNCVFC